MNETVDNPLIFGFEFDEAGGVRRLDWAEVSSGPAAPATGRRWLHLNRLSPAVRQWLTETSGIDEVIDDALLQEDTRPRCLAHGDGLLINLRGVNLNEGSEPEDMIAIRIWMTAEVIVSLRAFHIKAAQDLRDRIMAGEVPASNGVILAELAERLTDRIEPVVSELDEQADEYEDTLLEPGATLPKTALASFRRKVLTLRRYIIPQREALAHISREGQHLFDASQTLQLREIADRVTRIGEELDMIRERTMVLQEQLIEERSERMNQRLFVLSIISAIFLPLGFVTGLFGVNVGGMPGVGSPLAFTLLCLGMGGLTVTLFFLFRRMRWL
ncbi:zinc transporter ZntB [Henriciella aquimarina]|uniref:zinc transporter ZntB n=1 Tax=Henriciella aquimarina TaxID=545261 RepID=UPI001301D17A|nr:zinc transporter ZntB [Henriciella aquimarina]